MSSSAESILMELTEDQQLKIVETHLKMFLPHSQQVYGCVVLQNRRQCNSFKFLVDHWPEFNAIVCQPKYEQRGDLFKVTLIFAKEEASLKEIMHKTQINWTKYLCFGIDLCHEMIIMEVALEKNVSGRKVAVCHMMTLEDVSFLPPIDSSKVSVGSLDESHIALVNKTWTFGKGEDSVRMIQEMIINFPSCCVLDEESQQPVAWILMYTSCAMGMLYTLPGHRGKGYAKVLISSMAKKLHALGHPVYCFIEEENTVSLRLFKNMGFTEDPSYRAAWLAFNSL